RRPSRSRHRGADRADGLPSHRTRWSPSNPDSNSHLITNVAAERSGGNLAGKKPHVYHSRARRRHAGAQETRAFGAPNTSQVIKNFRTDLEHYRIAPEYDFTQPPPPGPL